MGKAKYFELRGNVVAALEMLQSLESLLGSRQVRHRFARSPLARTPTAHTIAHSILAADLFVDVDVELDVQVFVPACLERCKLLLAQSPPDWEHMFETVQRLLDSDAGRNCIDAHRFRILHTIAHSGDLPSVRYSCLLRIVG